MKQLSNLLILLCFTKLCLVVAQYEGPYLMFGLKELDKIQIPSLRAIDDRTLRELYSNATSIMVFVKNSTTKLNYENFPKLSELIQKNSWLYLPQQVLSSDPLDFNINAEVFTLTGSKEQQDVEIAALFRDSQITYGDSNVLGILATKEVSEAQRIFKRQILDSTTPEPSVESTDDSIIFEVKGKALLYSKSSPVLKIMRNSSVSETIFLKKKNAIVTSDERNDVFRIVVRYPGSATSDAMYFKFNFYNSSGNWYLDQLEVDMKSLNSTVLNVLGSAPSAPLGFSFGCNQSFVYQYRNITSQILVTLTINMIQVQPFIHSEKSDNNEITKFGRVYECVGILTPSIASGIFVTFIIAIGLTIAISAIMNIKPPNKFETKGSKQLTFTVQE